VNACEGDFAGSDEVGQVGRQGQKEIVYEDEKITFAQRVVGDGLFRVRER
jgi:hypothetical protein